MKPERYQRAMELFQQACEMPADQRVAFLDQACQDQPDLRQEVESLLAHHVAATISTKRNVQTTRNRSTRRASPSFRYLPRLGRRLLNLWPGLVGLALLLLLALLAEAVAVLAAALFDHGGLLGARRYPPGRI